MDRVTEIRGRCQALDLTPPSRKAITARVRLKPRREVAARRDGRKAARDRFAPAVGSLEAAWSLALIQIDHTLVDTLEGSNVEAARVALRSLIGTIPVFEGAGKLYGRIGVDPIPLYRRNPSTVARNSIKLDM